MPVVARRLPSALIASAAAVGLVLLPASPASADPTGSHYGSWTSATRSVDLSLDAVGFPAATYALPAGTAGSLAPAQGATPLLKATTPFGARYGAPKPQPYVSTLLGGAASLVTTMHFAAPTPPENWGFTLGDIDAESVRVIPLDADGHDLPPSVLGFQSSFDYDPSDDGLTGGPDLPTWDAATGTLSGHGAQGGAFTNSKGASGWFEPTQAISGLRFESTKIVGIPSWQLWLAVQTSSISGTVTEPDPQTGDPVPAKDTEVTLETPAGDPLPGPAGDPVITRTDNDGKYTFPDVVATPTEVVVVPPKGGRVTPAKRLVDPRTGDVTVAPFAVHPKRVAPTSTPSPTATSTSAVHTPAAAPVLTNTGGPTGQLLGWAAALVLSGGLVLFAARRRPEREH